MDNKTQTNKITRSPDSNTPESTWEYKITNNNNKYICKKEVLLFLKTFFNKKRGLVSKHVNMVVI